MTGQVLVPMDNSELDRSIHRYALERYPNDAFAVAHVIDDLEAGYGGRPLAIVRPSTPRLSAEPFQLLQPRR